MEVLIIPNKKEEILVFHANKFLLRLRGLIGWILFESTGLLITPCNQVHTFFMQYPIDVVYLSSTNRVLHIDESMKPYKVGKKVKHTKRILELRSGASKLFNINIGDTLEMKKTNITV